MTQGAVKTTGKRSRAVSAKKKAILSAALDTFSQFGFHGTRLEQIAELAGVSKTNLLYYFPSKEALYIAVLRQILDIWLAPLKAFREDFAPLAAIKEYIRLKLEVSRDYPQHLIFMIWASTQHYADFAPQVEAVTGATLRDEVFFNQTVENVQRIIIEGIRPR
ncbi:TetR family transcriptional regulator C-terminal domain-containing protein [Escherichia coli]|nr:TetR family transcriptional regulator C-terminal domain-containing protein [Escherichia coli]